MDFKNQVYLLTSDVQTERLVRSALGAEHHFELGGVCGDIKQLSARLDRQRAGLVLIDLDPEPLERVGELDPLVNQYIYSRFVVLTNEISGHLVLRAMQTGVRHVQAKDSIVTELAGVLHDLVPDTHLPALGSMITVFSASGGCGATTLAVNLANEVQLQLEQDVLVVDLDYDYGAVANYLELQNGYGVAEVLAHRGAIDYHLIRSTAVRHSERLHALLSPASVNGQPAGSLRPDKLDQMLRACRQAYAMTIVDAPRVLLDTAAALAHSSEASWIVLQPTVKDIRVAKSLHSGLMGRGVPESRVVAVVNRFQKRHQMISLEETRKALGDVQVAMLGNDYASAIRGINYGQPLSQAAPRSVLRRDLLHLAGPLIEQIVKQAGGRTGYEAELTSNNGGKALR